MQIPNNNQLGQTKESLNNHNRDWDQLMNDAKTLKPKESFMINYNLNKRGVYLLQINLLSSLATPGRNVTAIIKVKSQNVELFNEEKLLFPIIGKSKKDENDWSVFIPIEDKLDSVLFISYKSNAIMTTLEISTILSHYQTINKEENTKVIEEYQIKNSKHEDTTPSQIVTVEETNNNNPPLFESLSQIQILEDEISEKTTTESKEENNSSKEIEMKELSSIEEKEKEKEIVKEKEKDEEQKEKKSEDIQQIDQTKSSEESIQEKVVQVYSYKAEDIIDSPLIDPSQTNNNNNNSSSEYVLVEKSKEIDAENIVYETINEKTKNPSFPKKTVFEDYNSSVCGFSKYVKTISLSPGIYALQLDINNKIQSMRRSLQITYKILCQEEGKKDIKQNLIEKFSQKQILLLKKNYIFLKPDIYVPNENCIFWIKLKSPILIPIKVDVKLIQTGIIENSEHILSSPLKQINDVKNLIGELVPVKKNVWSIQKSLSFNKTEIFEIELVPGVYSFFISKLDNLDIPLRNFKCNITLENEKLNNERQSVCLKTISVDEIIGDGENSKSDVTVGFECETECILRIQLDAGVMSVPIPFYARVQKISKLDWKTIKHEGTYWLYYTCVFLGFFVFLRYLLLFVHFFSSFSFFGFNFELLFLFVFLFWFYSSGQLSNIKSYLSKIDELRMKSGFEMFKTILNRAKTEEESRQLELLNRKFDN